MTSRSHLVLLAAAASVFACSENSIAAREGNAATLLDGTVPLGSMVRVDVFPGTVVDNVGNLRALPQTVGPFTQFGEALQVGAIDLVTPSSLSGVVLGDDVAPWADGAQLPAERGPVAATVRVGLAGTVQQYEEETDEAGFYDVRIVPAEQPYELSVVPDDPSVPFGTWLIPSREDEEVVDFDLGQGASLYGQVLGEGLEPIQGARVHAVNDRGVRSSTAYTDSAGWYIVRVQPGSQHSVVCLGRDHGRDPVITSLPTDIPDNGARVDIDYPSLDSSFSSGRVTRLDGDAISGATVRFTATSLAGYDGVQATLVVEDTTDSNGTFDASLLRGDYNVEILPPDPLGDGSEVGPLRFATEAGSPLGDLALPQFVEVSGLVLAAVDEIAADARITCSELGFGERQWTTFSTRQGDWAMALPPTQLRCQVQPPAELTSRLAWTTTVIDPSISPFHDLELREGARISGTVRFEGAPEPFGLVEVRDGLGVLLGSAITSSDGADAAEGSFALRVDLPDQAADAQVK